MARRLLSAVLVNRSRCSHSMPWTSSRPFYSPLDRSPFSRIKCIDRNHVSLYRLRFNHTESSGGVERELSAEEQQKEQEAKDELDFMLGLSKETLERWTKMSDKERRRYRGLRAVGGEDGSGQRTVQYDGIRDNRVPRWYENVDIEEVAEALNPCKANVPVYTVTLDHRQIITRNKRALLLPSRDLALLIASDWETNTDDHAMTFAKMPMMQLAVKAIDDAASFRDYYTNELLELLACDLTCIRERPTSPMGRAQNEAFDPLVSWFKESVGLDLDVSTPPSIECDHPPRTVAALTLFWETLDDFSFMALHSLALTTKSVLLAFALWHNRIDVDMAASYVQLEEDVQSKTHGRIDGAHDLKSAVTSSDAYFDAMGDIEQLLATKRQREADKSREDEEYRSKTMAEFILNQVRESKSESEREGLRLFAMSIKEGTLPAGTLEKLEIELKRKSDEETK